MVDKSAFVKMLLHVLNVEAHTDNPTKRCEEELTSFGACNASGVVDVKHFVAFCLPEGAEGTKNVLGVLSRPQQDYRWVDHAEPSNEMLAATNTNPSNISGRDRGFISTTFEMAPPLPSLEDQAGAVLVVDSKQYVLGERLGHGAGGSVFAATLKREAVDVREVTDGGLEESDSHDPESMALKLVGVIDNAEFRGADRRLAAVAVEAVTAAVVRCMAHDDVMRWQGRVFLPVLHTVGKVEAIGDRQVQNMSALAMERADGTLHGMQLG
eukprot:4766463-Amphidinium_carterae.1